MIARPPGHYLHHAQQGTNAHAAAEIRRGIELASDGFRGREARGNRRAETPKGSGVSGEARGLPVRGRHLAYHVALRAFWNADNDE